MSGILASRFELPNANSVRQGSSNFEFSVLDHFFARKLVEREHGSRVLRITDAGSQFLKQQLGIELE